VRRQALTVLNASLMLAAPLLQGPSGLCLTGLIANMALLLSQVFTFTVDTVLKYSDFLIFFKTPMHNLFYIYRSIGVLLLIYGL